MAALDTTHAQRMKKKTSENEFVKKPYYLKMFYKVK